MLGNKKLDIIYGLIYAGFRDFPQRRGSVKVEYLKDEIRTLGYLEQQRIWKREWRAAKRKIAIANGFVPKPVGRPRKTEVQPRNRGEAPWVRQA